MITKFGILNSLYFALFALCISLRGTDGNGDFDALLKGIQAVKSFIFSEPFHLDKAVTFAAKAAYASQIISTDQNTIEKFTNPTQVAEATIVAPHNTRLQRLRKSNPEAFFYWWKAT